MRQNLHRSREKLNYETNIPACLRDRVCGLGVFAVQLAHAQNYPNKEIHAIVGFPAGSGADVYARYFANKLSVLAKCP